MARKSRLGKGLGALIPEKAFNEDDILEKEGIREISLAQIEPNPHQPRQDFHDDTLEELQKSITEHGIIQPLVVVRKDNCYVIVAGERRYRAAKRAGLNTVPCIVRALEDYEIMEIALVENLQREDLSPLEEALAFKALAEEFSLTQQQISEKVGKSRSYVANMMRLLGLPPQLQQLLSDGQLTVGHARALLSLDTSQLQAEVAKQVIKRKLNVRQTEKLIQKIQSEAENVSRETSPESHVENLILKEFEDNLTYNLGTNVKIKHGKKKGYIEIEYYSEEELERLVSILGSTK